MYKSFREFQDGIREGIKNVLPEEFKNASVDIKVIKKNNGLELTALTITKPNVNIAPTIYLDHMYEQYKEGEQSFDDVLANIARLRMEYDCKVDFETECITSFEKCKHMIMPRLINKNENLAMLEDVVHTDIEDLSVIYAIVVNDFESDGTASIIIRNEFFKNWNITKEELHNVAMANLRESKPDFEPLSNIIKKIMRKNFVEQNMDEEELESVLENMVPVDNELFVLTNENKIYGAVEVLHSEFMDSILDRLDSDKFYILPSSVHEVIIVSQRIAMNIEALREMVDSVNTNEVSPDEILSYNVYEYSRENGLKIA